jgi:uncharacterized OB-fold protein
MTSPPPDATTRAQPGDWLVAPELAPDAADRDVAPLYEAAARGVLAMPFCAGCGIPLELEQSVCDSCGTPERRWREVPRTGTVHAATLVHRREPGLIVAEGPYPVVDVELASGHRIVLTTASAYRHVPVIGAPVEIVFRTVGAVTLPAAQVTAPSAGELPTGELMS